MSFWGRQAWATIRSPHTLPTTIICHRGQNFNSFWNDEGAVCDPKESWYFRLPIEEKRRKYAEIKSQKRNLFRKRYLLMDQIIPAYVTAIRQLFRKGFSPVPSAIDEATIVDKPADYDPIEAPKQ